MTFTDSTAYPSLALTVNETFLPVIALFVSDATPSVNVTEPLSAEIEAVTYVSALIIGLTVAASPGISNATAVVFAPAILADFV